MMLDIILYWTGAAFWIAVSSLIVVAVVYYIAQVTFSVLREIWVWMIYDDFATWWSYQQFKKEYRYPNDECPHCGGTGLKDDDDEAKRELERLKNFCRSPERRFMKYVAKQKAKAK